MLISKRAIPRVATAGLVLGGAACKSSDANPSSISADLCIGFYECDYTGFYLSFYDMAECRDTTFDYYAYEADVWRAFEGSACEDAFLDYYGCYWHWYRASCDAAVAYDSCDGEFFRFSDLCYL